MTHLLAAFEDHLRMTCGSGRTVIAYIADAKAFLAFAEDQPPAIDLVERWVNSLNHGRMRPQSIARKKAGLRRWLGYAARHGDDVAGKTLEILRDYRIGPPVREADVQQRRAVTEAEYQEARSKATPRYKALVDILWWSGCRISEVVGDETAGIPALTIGQAVLLVQTGTIITRGKGGKRRIIVLPAVGREALKPYVDSQTGQASPSRALFPITTQAVHAALRRLGLPSAHSFRHAYRAKLRLAGLDEDTARALMGHGPKNITAAYGTPGAKELLLAAERLTPVSI
jgi:site-specific recombinase XerD